MRCDNMSMEELEAKRIQIEQDYDVADDDLKVIDIRNLAGINITVKDRNTGEIISYIDCHLDNDRMHIHNLRTDTSHLRKKFATYLMVRVIRFAEEHKLQRITVHPVANKQIISQKDLKDFYEKFSFATESNPEKTLDFVNSP